MSSRRNGSVSRAAEAASKSRLHMDRNPQHARITDPAHPAGRRKEIDNVMKRARQGSPGTWDRKLLEVEEKDPNRWRHTGYKQLYLEGERSVSPRTRSRSPIGRRSRSPLAGRRSPVVGRRSPLASRRSRSPVRRERSPLRRSPRRSPAARRTPPARPSPRRAARPRSPPRRPSPRAKRPPEPPSRPKPPPAKRPPSPPPRPSSGSGSSASSCSDESCSVCSAKNKKGLPPPPPPKGVKVLPRAGSASPRRRPPPPGAPTGARAVQPTRELLKAREASKRSREEKVLEWQRTQLAVNPRPPAPPGPAPPAAPIPPAHIKREGERRAGGGGAGGAGPRRPRPAPPGGPRAVSPAAIQAALADSGSDSDSEPSDQPPPRLTLSERFGKMAQWSADRSARLENMRITRRDSALHVAYIERGAHAPDARAEVAEADDMPAGSYPSELLAVAPAGLSWDDVRVRYDYYKKRGYLRGLTLADYVKWEDWWYKYQEWLKRERAYERWADAEVGAVRRERRRRGGRHRRS